MRLLLTMVVTMLAVAIPEHGVAQRVARVASGTTPSILGLDAPQLRTPTTLEHRLDPDTSSGATVIFGAVTFSTIAGGIALLAGVTEDRPKLGASIASVGIGGGALIGARMGRRKPAYLTTLAGASVGAVPLVIGAHEPGDQDFGYALQVIGLYSLSVIGAWLGNTLGQ